jgi:hypothetical protein
VVDSLQSPAVGEVVKRERRNLEETAARVPGLLPSFLSFML